MSTCHFRVDELPALLRGTFWTTLLFFYAFAPVRSVSAVDVRTVALSDGPVPGAAADSVFDFFRAPTINNAGNTAFMGHLVIGPGGVSGDNNRGVWSEGHGPLALVAQGMQQAPGTPSGALFGSFESQVLLSDSGDVAFVGQLRYGGGGVNSINEFGIWSQTDGLLSLVAREQEQAPGTPAGANFSVFGRHVQQSDPHGIAFSKSGQVAFGGRIANNVMGEGGVTGSTGSGIWSQQAGATTLFVRSGDQAPETPVGTLLQINTSDLPSISPTGQIAFASELVGPSAGVDSSNKRGIWSNGHGALALIARKGSQAPGFAPGEVFDRLSAPVINSAGDIVFDGTLQGSVTPLTPPEGGIWTNRDGPVTLVARNGMQAPGAIDGVSFQAMGNAVINGAGGIAFTASLRSLSGSVAPSIADHGIWTDASGELRLVARSGLGLLMPGDPVELMQGTPVPGYSSGTRFSIFNDYVLNRSGQVAFTASIFDSTSPGSARGVWAQDRSGVLRLIVATGSQLDVDNGPGVDLRTVNAIDFVGTSGNEDGHASAFNDLGQLAFAARFTDGSWGVFVSNVAAVPEPSTLGFALAAILIAANRRPSRACTTR